MSALKIILADDHAIVRHGVKQILAGAFPAGTFGEAANAHDLLALVRGGRWDIVVLDLTMPGNNGLDMLKLIKHAYRARILQKMNLKTNADLMQYAMQKGLV